MMENIESRKQGNIQESNPGRFRKLVKDWMRNVDGDDFCSECWSEYLKIIQEKGGDDLADDAKRGAMPLARVAETCKCSDGYFVVCHRCNKTISCEQL